MSELKPCAPTNDELNEAFDLGYQACLHDNEKLTWDAAEELQQYRRAQPANDPLTLEQLREMHGQPVWVVPNRGIAKWYLVDVANDCCSTCDMDVVDFELYGPKDKSYGWLAYRRKPEPEGRTEK